METITTSTINALSHYGVLTMSPANATQYGDGWFQLGNGFPWLAYVWVYPYGGSLQPSLNDHYQ